MSQSYIENRFEKFWAIHGDGIVLESQFCVASSYDCYPYRIDYYHLPTATAIELDGKDWHSSPEQIAEDRAREQWIALQIPNVRFIRLTGAEVVNDPVRSVYKVRGIIKNRKEVL